ncbi:MAG: agarase [Bacteroidia bacterium]|nr:agarase [Bacteroidia bacterium]
MKRRSFLNSTLSASALILSFPIISCSEEIQAQNTSSNFFTLHNRKDRWWLMTPEGKPFFSIGLNHIDPASMRYPENIHLWREKYEGKTTKWLKESVAKNLQEWGFNTIGWEQEVTVRQWRHSRSFTYEEYQALNMPYCHMLPFTEFHQWEQHTSHFDFFDPEWEEWCDYVARSHCAELSEDPKLIGYFYSDCPTWIHNRPHNKWRGPLFDPEKLDSEAGRKELTAMASKYYKTIYEAIRRYDKNHLIFGDRYEANAPIADEVINAALPYVDVLSFQDFRDPVKHLKEWHTKTGKPVLLADAAKMKWQTVKGEFSRNNGKWYAETLAQLFENPGCIGFHLCGAYQRNKARRYGLLDEQERPDGENVALMKEANEKILQLVKESPQ